MKKGKYVGHKFNAEQTKARTLWKYALENETKIVTGLMINDFGNSRKELHEVLDRRLDQIERMRAEAEKLFPDVDESFVVSSITI